MGPRDAAWAFVAAVAAAAGGWFAFKTRLGLSWVARKMREAFNNAFRDAVDEHVEPKFAQLRTETVAIATALEQKVETTAAALKVDTEATAGKVEALLAEHTAAEQGAVRETIDAALAPLTQTVEAHVADDVRRLGRIEAKLDIQEV